MMKMYIHVVILFEIKKKKKKVEFSREVITHTC